MMLNKNLTALLLLVFFIIPTYGQDIEYARKTVKKLSSKTFFGRGYVKNGDAKAAHFIVKELQKNSIAPLSISYFQDFDFKVNTYPGKALLIINNKKLKPGTDFTLRSLAPLTNGSFDLVKLDTSLFRTAINNDLRKQLSGKLGYYDTIGWGNKWYDYFFRSKSPLPFKGTILIVDQTPALGISTRTSLQTSLIINRNAFPKDAQSITLDIETKSINHTARNVIGIIPGVTDTFIIFSAHYDHLGGLGNKTYFPGANDNASGTAMVLDIARELSKAPKPKYSYVFVFFAGEEAGLLGSYHFTSNPPIPLNKIKMVLNLDMVATGADGLSIFNGTEHTAEFAKLDSLNRLKNYNIKLLPKKLSRNNDLYPFSIHKVKGFTFLTEEKNAPYHTVTDTYNTLSFLYYENIVKLIKDYINTL